MDWPVCFARVCRFPTGPLYLRIVSLLLHWPLDVHTLIVPPDIAPWSIILVSVMNIVLVGWRLISHSGLLRNWHILLENLWVESLVTFVVFFVCSTSWNLRGNVGSKTTRKSPFLAPLPLRHSGHSGSRRFPRQLRAQCNNCIIPATLATRGETGRSMSGWAARS